MTGDTKFEVKHDALQREAVAKNSQLIDRRKDHISHFILRLAFARR